LEKSKVIVVNLTPKKSEEEEDVNVDSNNNHAKTSVEDAAAKSKKSLDDEVDNLVEELLRIGDGKMSTKSGAGSKQWKQQQHRLNITDEHQMSSRFDTALFHERTPISTGGTKSKAANLSQQDLLGQHSKNGGETGGSNSDRLHQSTSGANGDKADILTSKTSSYYNDVKNKEIDFSSFHAFVRDPAKEQQQQHLVVAFKKPKQANFTYRSDVNTDAIIEMNGEVNEESGTGVSASGDFDEPSGERNMSAKEQIRLINLRVNLAADDNDDDGNEEDNETDSVKTKRSQQTFYNGQKVWTATTDHGYKLFQHN
jgi:hypothetical protein